jgi:5-methylcytosine-specific restriction endonuclease McrA
MVMKICSKCKIEQTTDNFIHDKSRIDGLFPQCKMCRKIDKHQYYLENKEHINQMSKEWYAENPDNSKAIKKRYRDTHKEEISARMQIVRKDDPDRFRAHNRRYYQKHRNKILLWRKRYYEEHPEKSKEKYKKYMELHGDEKYRKWRQWYEQNREIHNERTKRWGLKNRHKQLSYVHKRRARKLSNGGQYTNYEWEKLKEYYDYTCLCCNRKEPEIQLTIDHVIPIFRGGTNDISNIQPLCKRCNQSKHTKTTDYRKGANHVS